MARIEQYRRQSMGVQAPRVRSVTDISGLVRGVERVAKVAVREQSRMDELEEKRLRRIDNLRVLNESNRLTQRFRDRYFETSQTRGEDALNLYGDESEYVQEQRENYRSSIEGLDPDTANRMLNSYDTITENYLNRISDHTRSEALRFEKKVMEDTTTNLTQQTIDSEPGDFQAIESLASNINKVYSGYPDEIVKNTDEAILETYRQWTIINPDKSIRSYQQNKKKLQELMGDRYAEVDRIIQIALKERENNLREREKQADDARKQYIDDFNDAALNTIVLAQKGNEQAQVEMFSLQEKIMSDPILPATGVGGKQWWITNLQNIRDSVNTRDYTLISGYYDRAYDAALTEDDEKRLWHNVSIGRMSVEDAKGILSTNKQYTEKPEDPVMESWKEEYKTLKGLVLGKGLIIGAGPDHHYALAQARAYALRELDKQKDVNKKLDMLDPLSKNYVIQKAYNKYRVPDVDALNNQVRRIQAGPGIIEATEENMDAIAFPNR